MFIWGLGGFGALFAGFEGSGSGFACSLHAVGETYTFGISAHPLIASLRQHVKSHHNPTTLNEDLGFAPPPPETPSKGAFLPFAVLFKGAWVLAACAGRSRRSKGSQQTTCPSHLVIHLCWQGKPRRKRSPVPWELGCEGRKLEF